MIWNSTDTSHPYRDTPSPSGSAGSPAPRTRQALGPRSRPVSVGPGSISSGSGAVGSSTRTGSPGTRTSWTAGDITDEPGLYLALGEAVNGPGGYFGGCLDALVDCLRGNFGYTAPATLLWRDAATAREHLSRVLAPEGEQYDLVALVLEVLTDGGMHVTFR